MPMTDSDNASGADRVETPIEGRVNEIDEELRTTLPKELIAELDITGESKVSFFPVIERGEVVLDVAVGDVSEQYGPSRHLLVQDHDRFNEDTQTFLRFTTTLARVLNLFEWVNGDDERYIEFSVDTPRDFRINFVPSVRPYVAGGTASEIDSGMEPVAREWQMTKEPSGTKAQAERFRIELPVDWVDYYGVERFQDVGFRLVMRDGRIAIAVDFDDDAGKRHDLTRRVQEHAPQSYEGYYVFDVPRKLVHATRLVGDVVQLTPEDDGIIIGQYTGGGEYTHVTDLNGIGPSIGKQMDSRGLSTPGQLFASKELFGEDWWESIDGVSETRAKRIEDGFSSVPVDDEASEETQ